MKPPDSAQGPAAWRKKGLWLLLRLCVVFEAWRAPVDIYCFIIYCLDNREMERFNREEKFLMGWETELPKPGVRAGFG